MASPSQTLSLSQILSESKRIITLQRRHFQTLTFLFLFPLSVGSLLYLATQRQHYNIFQSQEISRKFLQAFNQTPNQFILFPLLWTLVSNLFFLFAAASMSYSVYRVSHDEPVDLISSLKSVLRSFWPLVSTSLVMGLIWVSISIPFPILVVLVYKWLHNSSYFFPCVVVMGLIFALVLIYLQVNWMLAYAIAVMESKWGYAPLKRSAYLVKGNRRVALSMLLYFSSIVICLTFGFTPARWMGNWWSVLLNLLFGSFLLSQTLLVYFAATTVLYIYCSESHEGLPSQNPEKFPLLLQ